MESDLHVNIKGVEEELASKIGRAECKCSSSIIKG